MEKRDREKTWRQRRRESPGDEKKVLEKDGEGETGGEKVPEKQMKRNSFSKI